MSQASFSFMRVSIAIPFIDPAMIQCNIHVHSADMGAAVMRHQHLRNPSTDENNVIFVFTQKMHQLYEHRTCSLHAFCCIIPARYHVISLLTIPALSHLSATLPLLPRLCLCNSSGQDKSAKAKRF